MQIRTRLTLWFTSLTALLLIGCLFFIYYFFLTTSRESYFSGLRSRAVMIFVMYEKNNPGLEPNFVDNENSGQFLPDGENIVVYDYNGTRVFSLFASEDIPGTYLSKLRQNKEIKFSIKQHDYTGINYTSNTGRKWLIFAKGHFNSTEVASLSRILLLTFFVFVIILSWAGYYFSGKVLTPVNEAMNEIDSINAADLSKRLTTGENNDEIDRLTKTFNRLLDRIEDGFKTQKGFLSNFSHEVRNPIGAIIASIQVSLAKERPAEEYRKTMKTILQDAQELEHTSYQLMELARLSTKSNPTLLQPVRIDEVVWQSKAAVRKLHPEYHFRFDDTNFPADEKLLTIIGNESLLKSAFMNLFENACKFSPDKTAVLSVLNPSQKEVCVRVSDSASTLTDDEKEWIFKPFYRTEHAKDIQGSGIGLSLVHSILHLHKGRLSVDKNPEGGNIFCIHFSLHELN
jgi:signal transduction histidine kinase